MQEIYASIILLDDDSACFFKRQRADVRFNIHLRPSITDD
jgi:hypothetical protein